MMIVVVEVIEEMEDEGMREEVTTEAMAMTEEAIRGAMTMAIEEEIEVVIVLDALVLVLVTIEDLILVEEAAAVAEIVIVIMTETRGRDTTNTTRADTNHHPQGPKIGIGVWSEGKATEY